MKVNIGKVFQALGRGTLIAAETTPQGALVGGILRRIPPVAKGLGLTDHTGVPVPGDLDGDGIPDEVDLRAVSVDPIMDSLPTLLPTLMSLDLGSPVSTQLAELTDAVENWLNIEAEKAQIRSAAAARRIK